MKVGSTVMTPQGLGEIIKIDLLKSKNKRYIVRLDKQHFDIDPAYCSKEISIERRDYFIWIGKEEYLESKQLSNDEWVIAEALFIKKQLTREEVRQLLDRHLLESEIMRLKRLKILKIENR